MFSIMSPTDPATLTIALYTVLAGLIGVGFYLGRYTMKVDGVREALKETEAARKESQMASDASRRELEEKIDRKFDLIFSKLDALVSRPPHVCEQVNRLIQIESEIAATRATLVGHGERMNRIQATSVHDRETERQPRVKRTEP